MNGEVVHHIDCNSKNNRKSNLIALCGRKHAQLHRYLDDERVILEKSAIEDPSAYWQSVIKNITMNWLSENQVQIVKIWELEYPSDKILQYHYPFDFDCAMKSDETQNNIEKPERIKKTRNRPKIKKVKPPVENNELTKCSVCDRDFLKKRKVQKYCSYKCSRISSRKCVRPTKNELETMLKEKNSTKIAEEYGVSETAVRKWCKKYNMDHSHRRISKMSEEKCESI